MAQQRSYQRGSWDSLLALAMLVANRCLTSGSLSLSFGCASEPSRRLIEAGAKLYILRSSLAQPLTMTRRHDTMTCRRCHTDVYLAVSTKSCVTALNVRLLIACFLAIPKAQNGYVKRLRSSGFTNPQLDLGLGHFKLGADKRDLARTKSRRAPRLSPLSILSSTLAPSAPVPLTRFFFVEARSGDGLTLGRNSRPATQQRRLLANPLTVHES